jgi:hypothetical protein
MSGRVGQWFAKVTYENFGKTVKIAVAALPTHREAG